MRVTQLSRNLANFWRDARGDRIVPLYTDIYPERLGLLLPSVFCLTWRDDGVLVNRMLGSAISEVVGSNETGGDFFSFSRPDALEPSREFLRKICAHPCAGVSILVFRGRGGLPREFEIMYFPVEDSGVNSRIIGAIHSRSADFHYDEMRGPTQVIRYSGSSFIDIGCGTPRVGAMLAETCTMSLEDVFEETSEFEVGRSLKLAD